VFDSDLKEKTEKMIGQGGWDVYVTGVNGFVGKDGVVKGGIFDAQTGNPWCHKDCSRFHPTEVQKMIAAMRAGVADVEFTASKQKYKIAKIEKNNTLLFAFGQMGPLVLTITEGEKCIVVGFGDEKSETGAMTAAVERTTEYISKTGY
jgi:hypothetical protein